jgi:hypothetical protein
LDLTKGNPIITTRSFVTGDGGVPEKIMGKTDRGNIVEVNVARNGTWVKSITVRDGSTNGIDWTINDTIIITNIYQPLETIELSGLILTHNPEFVYALNRGEEFVLVDVTGSKNSLINPYNRLTKALTGGIYFKDSITDDVNIINGLISGRGVTINITCTKLLPNDSYGLVSPVLKLIIGNDKTNVQCTFNEGDVIIIRNNYQTITKLLTLEDSILLNR